MSTVRTDSPSRRTATKRIAIVGNPNSGKTTLFNRLTGLRHKVGNYPGVTVERREGFMSQSRSIRLLDLPGCYSLSPRSLDERLARDVLLGWAQGVERPDAVVVTRLSRFMRNARLTLNVVHELREMGVALICKDEPIDTRQRGVADLVLAVLSTMAEWESDRLSEYAKESRQRFIAQGRWPGGKPPPIPPLSLLGSEGVGLDNPLFQ